MDAHKLGLRYKRSRLAMAHYDRLEKENIAKTKAQRATLEQQGLGWRDIERGLKPLYDEHRELNSRWFAHVWMQDACIYLYHVVKANEAANAGDYITYENYMKVAVDLYLRMSDEHREDLANIRAQKRDDFTYIGGKLTRSSTTRRANAQRKLINR